MRWLFAFVLLLNIIYIVWQLNIPEVENKPGNHTRNSTVGENVRSIVLLSELTASGEDEAAEPMSKATSTVAHDSIKANADTQDVACYSIGPFYQHKKLRLFKREIESYVDGQGFSDLSPDSANPQRLFFQERVEAREIIYWVYIEPERNRQAAIALGKRLKANKINDYYVIRQGDKNNGVSLGHFKNEKRAKNVVNKVKRLGIEVTIDPLHKGEKLFWLDFHVTRKQGDSGTIVVPETIKAEVARLGAAGSKSKINVTSRRCDFDL